MERIWYVAYGSNLAAARFRCYLSGGRPAGAGRVYAGARDPGDPRKAQGVSMPGGLAFAGVSTVWHGGMAFYDRSAPGVVAAHAYLVTVEQFADVVAQELREPPGGELARDLGDRLPGSESVVMTGGHLYSTVTHLGELEGAPMFTITHHDVGALQPTAPSAAYLRWIAIGLREAHGYDDARVAAYLARAKGVHPVWTEAELLTLAAAARSSRDGRARSDGADLGSPRPGVDP